MIPPRHHRLTRPLTMLVALVALAALGCRPKPRASEPTEHVTAAQPNTPPEAAEPDKAPATNSGAAAEPKHECIDDRTCKEYLRCEDGECKVPPAIEGREVAGMPVATFRKGDQELGSFKLEIADDPWERTRGLMFRRKMDPSFGMLFVFDSDQLRSFWMKNTLIPLDMVHIDASGTVVGVVANAEPMTLTPRETGKPARYVLELTAGRAAEVGIEAGVKMDITGLPEEQAPK